MSYQNQPISLYQLTASRQVVKESDWSPLENKASKFFKEKQSFDRLHVSIPDLKKMFGYSKYKMYYIENLLPPEGSTVYRCGSLVDLCLGPHIQNTSKIKAFQITKVSLGRLLDFTLVKLIGLELVLLFSWRQRRRFITTHLRCSIPRQKADD